MANISMKNLLEAGVHFGHQTRRWNPKMGRYIFGSRNNIHIIDLQKTVRDLKKAYKYVRDEVANGKTILFVGTKRQAQESIMQEAERCDMYYVNHRWLGGMLTNFDTIRKSIERFTYLENLKNSPVWDKLSKKEISRLEKELYKLNRAFCGIKKMEQLPGIMFVIDPIQEKTAIMEARRLEIPVVSVIDTDCDPDIIDIPIPGNDDAIRAIKLFVSVFADAAIEGKRIYEKQTAIEKEGEEEPKEVEVSSEPEKTPEDKKENVQPKASEAEVKVTNEPEQKIAVETISTDEQ